MTNHLRPRGRIAGWAGAAGLCLLVWCLACASVASASTVSGLNAKVSPTQAGATSTYSITFTATHGLLGGDQIFVFAPSGTVFPSPTYPCTACAPDLSNYSLLNNARYHGVVLGSASVGAGGSYVDIGLYPDYSGYSNDVPPMTSLTLTITGVTNPTRAAGHTLMVATSEDQDQAISNTYTITPGPAAAVAVSSGSAQSTTVANAFAAPLKAQVTDQYGNPVAGSADITFTAPSSGAGGTFAGGSLTDTVPENSAGVATSSTFTAGTQSGTYSVQATMGSAPPADFTLTNLAGPGIRLTVSAGDDQSTQVGSRFATPLSAVLLDGFGNPVPGQQVTFTAPATGASGTFAATSTNTDSATTDSSGTATASAFTANGTLGGYTVQVAAPGLTPITFTLTNLVGAPSQVVAASGGDQSAVVSQGFARPLEAEVADQFGDPIAGQTVTFTLPGGPAGATFTGGATSDTETTDSSGIATSKPLSAGTLAGSYVAQAVDGGLSASFALTNAPGVPAKLVAAGGDAQSAAVGSPFAARLQVRLVDRYGNATAVGNVPVTFSAPTGGPSATFATTGSGSEIDPTDSSGIATTSTLTAGSQLGAFTVEATATGLTAAGFSLSNLTGAAARLSLGAGDGQSTEVGTAFPHPLSALITDQYGHPLGDQSVTFRLPNGEATFAGGSTIDTETTDASGIATSVSVIALHTAGTFTAEATMGVAAPVGFRLTNLAGPAAQISLELRPGTIVANGIALTTATAVVADAYGNPLGSEHLVFSATGGQTISAAPSSGDGRYTATVRATDRDGSFTISATDTSAASLIRATATVAQVGSNRFRFGRLALRRRTGTATLTLVLPGSGDVILRGKGLKTDRVRAAQASTILLRISPTRALKRQLSGQGTARVAMHVTYAPEGGTSRTVTRWITLRERP